MEETGQHLDPTAEISLDTVKQRAVKGVVALTGRYFVLYIIALAAQLFLGAFLTTAQFGIYGLVSAIINFLVYFSDIGLAASLIQKKEKVTNEDLRTTFTVQQILVVILLVVLFFVSPFISKTYSLTHESMWLLYALGFSFFLSSLKTIPSVLLERSLKFEILAVSNIVENLVYNVVLVGLAWKGFGITSFTYAVVARGVTGLVTLYLFQPWKPRFAFHLASFKNLIKFGLPYQINTFIAVLKDDGLTLVLGKVMGLPALGILVWAQKWIQIPLRIVMDNVTRVTFPAFSRMQDDKESLENSVTRSIFFIAFLVFPATIAIVILAPVVFQIIPKYHQWLPAVLPLTFLAVNVLFASVSTQLTNVLNAIGKIKITSGLMVMWTLLTWGLVPFFAYKFGANGAALGYGIVGASSFVAIIIVKKYVNFSLGQSVVKPFFASFVMGVTLLVLRWLLPLSFTSLGISIAVGAVTYFATTFTLIGASLVTDVKKSFNTFLNRQD